MKHAAGRNVIDSNDPRTNFLSCYGSLLLNITVEHFFLKSKLTDINALRQVIYTKICG